MMFTFKRYFSLLLLVLSCIAGARAASPVRWSQSVEMHSDTEGVMTITASIDRGWHLFGMTVPDGGPISTSFAYEDQPGVQWQGSTKASAAPVETVDMVFHLKLPVWTSEVSFSRQFAITAPGVRQLTCAVRYQACDDRACIPPTVDQIVVKLPIADGAAADSIVVAQPENPVPTTAESAEVTVAEPAIDLEPDLDKLPEPWMPLIIWSGVTFFVTLLIPGIWPRAWFARFPERLQREFGAGGLLSTVKVTLAFLSLAMAILIYQLFDLTYGWGMLDRNMLIAILTGIMITLSLYLLGILKFSDTTYTPRVTAVRYILALAALSLAIYMVPGLWGAPVPLIEPLVPAPFHF